MKLLIMNIHFTKQIIDVQVCDANIKSSESCCGEYVSEDGSHMSFKDVRVNIPNIHVQCNLVHLEMLCRESDVNTCLMSMTLTAESVCGSMHIVDDGGLLKLVRSHIIKKAYSDSYIDYSIMKSLDVKDSELKDLSVEELDFLLNLLAENYTEHEHFIESVEKRDNRYCINGVACKASYVLDTILRSLDAKKYTQHIHDVLVFQKHKKELR